MRTPRGIGKPGKGALAHLHPQQPAATVLKALKERNNLDTSHVDDIIWSTSTQKGKQAGDLGRMAALAALDPVEDLAFGLGQRDITQKPRDGRLLVTMPGPPPSAHGRSALP